jgi:hypothetical protein
MFTANMFTAKKYRSKKLISILSSLILGLTAFFAAIALHHGAPAYSQAASIPAQISQTTSSPLSSQNQIAQSDPPTAPAADPAPESTINPRTTLTEAEAELLAKIGPYLWLIGAFSVVTYVFVSYCSMKIAEKLDVPNAWLAWVPIASIYILVKSAGKPGWWTILFFIPLVNLIISILVFVAIPERLNKSQLLTLLLFFLPLIGFFAYFGVLAFS